MKAQKPYTLLKRTPQGVWYYRLAGEKTRHSTGLTVKTLAERFVVGIIKGDIQWKDWIPAKSENEADAMEIDKGLKDDDRIGSTKTGKARVIFLHAIVLNLLKRWKEESPNGKRDDLIFSDVTGQPLKRKACLLYFKKILRENEIKVEDRNIVTHSLRHTANTIYRKVLTDDILRKFTGHSTKEMTDNYDHPEVTDTIALLSASAKIMENEFGRITA